LYVSTCSGLQAKEIMLIKIKITINSLLFILYVVSPIYDFIAIYIN
jgi:hypothetical protein